jgi:hypothetical protein
MKCEGVIKKEKEDEGDLELEICLPKEKECPLESSYYFEVGETKIPLCSPSALASWNN